MSPRLKLSPASPSQNSPPNISSLTEHRHTVVQALWTFLDQAISSGTNVLITLIVARSLSPRWFGSFSAGIFLYLLAVGTSRGLHSEPFLVRWSAQPHDSLKVPISSSLGSTALLAFSISLASITAAPFLSANLRAVLIPLAITLPGLLIQDASRYIFFATARPAAAALNDFIWAALQVPSLLILLRTGHSSVSLLFFAWGASASAAALLATLQLGNFPKPSLFAQWLRTHRGLALPYLLEFWALRGSAQLTFFFVGITVGIHAVGAIRGAQILLGPLTVLLLAARALFVPYGIRTGQKSGQLKRSAALVSASLATLSFIWAFALANLPESLGTAFLGSTWPSAKRIAPLLALSVASLALSEGPIAGLRILAAPKRSLVAQLLAGSFNLSLATLGSLLAGLFGAALGLWLAATLAALVWWLSFLHVARSSQPETRAHPRTLTVALNLITLSPRMAGVRTWTTAALADLLEHSPPATNLPALRFLVITSPAGLRALTSSPHLANLLNTSPDRVTLHVLRLPFIGRKAFQLLYEQLAVPLIAATHGAHLVHSFDYRIPYLSHLPTLATIHDLHYLSHPSTFTPFQRLVRRLTIPLTMRRARILFAVSRTSAREITQFFPSATNKVIPLNPPRLPPRPIPPPAPSSPHHNTPLPSNLAALTYFLAVGTIKPHKNHALLLQLLLHPTLANTHLIIVGRPDRATAPLLEKIRVLGLSNRVHVIGFIDERTLTSLYSRARLFLAPSRYEGLGITLLEAMSHGLPIACSDIPAHHEIAGPAAEYFSPLDPADALRAVRSALSPQRNSELRQAATLRYRHLNSLTNTPTISAAYLAALAHLPFVPLSLSIPPAVPQQ